MRVTVIPPSTPAPGLPFDVELTINDRDATWRDLWHTLAQGLHPTTFDPVTHVQVDERTLALDAAIERTLVPGAVVAFGAAHGQSSSCDQTRAADGAGRRAPARRLRVVGGLDAGATLPLGVGAHVVGRDAACAVPLASPTVSRTHALLTVAPDGATTVTDLGATNGVRAQNAFVRTAPLRIGHVVSLGATSIVLDDAPSEPARPTDAQMGRLVHNRPPRVRASAPGEVVRVPIEARAIAGRTPFSWAMLLAPVAIAGLMATLFSPMFAVFALLSPVVMIATWLEQRRRGSRERHRQSRAFATRLREFRTELDAAARRHEQWLERAAPDLATVVGRVQRHDSRLWERRPDHGDFGHLRVGRSSRGWCPALDHDAGAPECRDAISAHAQLHDAPLVIELGPGCVVGISGPLEVVHAVARALVVQAAVHHGPADLWTALATTDDRVEDWAALSWLPHHAASPDPDNTMGATTELALRRLGDRLSAARAPDAACGLVVIDATESAGATGPSAASFHSVAEAAAGAHAALVLVTEPHLLPASCTTTIECLDHDGAARLTVPATGERNDGVLLDGMGAHHALAIARRLARFADPLTQLGVGSLPASVSFHEALGVESTTLDAREILRRWSRHRDGTGLPAVVGVDTDGPHVIDLVADGPHALIGGTTGAGKSELLRSWVLALACTHAPDALTFVLIDYKGGSTFDGCAALPHVVGLVTDLDDRLASRALRSLDAEVRHREQRLRDAGVADVTALRTSGADAAPLPRLVVIIDEFATLATDVPGFLDALVSVAQRGRSLGVHLVLATQRPHGAVNDNIRTNANLRIALRLLDVSDSIDIIGSRDAAAIDRRTPGRVCSATGSEPPVAWQAAHLHGDDAATLTSDLSHDARVSCVRLDAFGRPLGADGPAAEEAPARLPSSSAVAPLVRCIEDAFQVSGLPQPRRPWLPPLGSSLPAHELHAAAHPAPCSTGARMLLGAVPLGLTDEPDIPRQRVWSWVPTTGPLVVYGMPGSGKTTLVRTVIDGLARMHRLDECHIYVIGAASPELASLATQPQVGAVIHPDERARVTRLLRWLEHQRHTRATSPSTGAGADPAIVVVVDGAALLTHVLDDLDGRRLLAGFLRLATEGPRLGLHLVLTGDRPQAVPAPVAAATDAKVVLRLPDPYDYSLLGIRAPAAPPGPGRGVLADGTEIQIAHADELSAPRHAAPARFGGTASRLPVPIGELPATVALRDLQPATADHETWTLPVGLDDSTLATSALDLAAGDHVLLAGPARSGRTTALLTLGCAFEYAALGRVAVLAPRPNALAAAFPDHSATATRLFEQLARHRAEGRGRDGGDRILVLIDDSDLIDDDRLQRLITRDEPALRVVAAGRSDRLRRAYTHWTRPLRDHRFGLVLDAAATSDGELWNVRIPDHASTSGTGRGALIRDGHVDIVQVAHP